MSGTGATQLSTRAIRQKRERRLISAVVAGCVVLSLGVFAVIEGPAWLAYWQYTPQEGDIIFQSLPRSRLVNAIEGVSRSPYSHCGLVAREEGRWVVYEALHGVEATPLREFLFRGRRRAFAVYRLKAVHQWCMPAMIEQAKTYLGRPYDVRYRMDDEQIYCSELIYKAFAAASDGQQLGTLVQLGDLNWQPWQETIRYFEGGPVPLEREMITPRNLAEASQLERVFSHEPGPAGC